MDPFAELRRHYQEIIDVMPNRFNAHKFICELAHQHQRLYVQALAQYVETDAPFMIVHGRLAKTLSNSGLVDNVGEESSIDIFGQSNNASVWVKK